MHRRRRRRATVVAIVGLMLVLTGTIGTRRAPLVLAQPATPAPTAPPIGCRGDLISPALEVLLVVQPTSGSPNAALLDRVRTIVARRAEILAGDGCRVWTDGIDRILVQFAGPDAPAVDVATEALTGTGLLEIIDPQGQALSSGMVVRTSLGGPDGATPAPGPVYDESIVGGADIADAFVTQDLATGRGLVGFELTPEAADRFCVFTTDQIGKPSAIVLDKEVVSTPIVNSPICGGQGVVAGLTSEESQALVVQLLSGALPTPIEVVAVQEVVGTEATVLVEGADTGSIPGVLNFAYQGAIHEDGPIDYAEEPPVGGPHNLVWQNCGFYDAPIPDETAVHSLEHGAVWITYHPDLPLERVAALRGLAESTSFVLVSPYLGQQAPVVVTAWNHQLHLRSASDTRLSQFIRLYRKSPEVPEPQGICMGGYSGTREEWQKDHTMDPTD